MNPPKDVVKNAERLKATPRSARHPWLIFASIGAIAVVLPLAYWEAEAQLNIRGICVNEMRKIPDEELIRPWVEAAVRNYPPPDPSFQRNEKGEWISALQYVGEPISYRDTKDFFILNPGCCVIQNFDPRSGFVTDESQRRLGHGRGFIKLEYKLRYRTSDGAEHFRMYSDAAAITNCGQSWRPF